MYLYQHISRERGFLCFCLSIYLSIYHTHAHTHTHLSIDLLINLLTCVCVCVCVCNAHTHTHAHTHIYIYIGTYETRSDTHWRLCVTGCRHNNTHRGNTRGLSTGAGCIQRQSALLPTCGGPRCFLCQPSRYWSQSARRETVQPWTVCARGREHMQPV